MPSPVPHVSRTRIRVPDLDAPLDIFFDGRRVWSFHPRLDGRRVNGGRVVPWPRSLRPFLRGASRVEIRPHGAEQAIFDDEIQFSDDRTRVDVSAADGTPLGVDKSGRLQKLFTTRTGADIHQLLDEVSRLLDFLEDDCGVPSFLSYGCLLGAVREGRMIGHDFDVDVSYLSRHTHPLDVTLESFRIEHRLSRAGFRTRRMSSDDFKVMARLDGGQLGIDVFGSFYVDDIFYLMGEVSGPLPRTALLPQSTVALEGHSIKAPADPAALLELTYGRGWQQPDPAFRFATPRRVKRRLSGWMRGENDMRRYWDEFHSSQAVARVPTEPSPFALWVAEREGTLGRVVDAGTGTGRDAIWLARRGARVRAFDYTAGTLRLAARRAEEQGVLGIEFESLNLYEARQALGTAAAWAYEWGTEPPMVYARFLLDALRDQGRANFWRVARMLLRGGGRLYLEFRTDRSRGIRHNFGTHWRQYLDPELVVAELEAAGAHLEDLVTGRGLARLRGEDPEVCRIVAAWQPA
ncbi:MAG TPA: methyltransferase domain-containing protein [Nocardioidaceae bacterium]|nr:methyltransferase domain-containing protein [Nocardioidaceae bacterium]